MDNESNSRRIIVVGSGVIGIACAHYLNQSGWQVDVIDKSGIGQECSHGNCGYICPSHVAPLTEPGAIGVAAKSLLNPKSPFRVKPSLNPSFLNWMWQFARRCTHTQVIEAGKSLSSILNASMHEYQQLFASNTLDCHWNQGGLMYVFRSQQALDKFSQNHDWLAKHFDVNAQRLTGEQLAELDSGLKPSLAGAVFYPADATVRPDELNRQWAAKLADQGVRFIENCELQSIHQSDGVITSISTSLGEMSAVAFVFAMGAVSTRWAKALGCRIPIQPGKGYSVTIPCDSAMPQHSMLFPEEKIGVTPFAGALRLGSMMEFVGYDNSIPDFRIGQLREAAGKYLLASVDEPEQERWFGWRPMTWDSLPVIGPVPSLHNAFLATGHNMLGLSMAPATGRLVAEIINRQPTHIPCDPFSVTRFGRRSAASS